MGYFRFRFICTFFNFHMLISRVGCVKTKLFPHKIFRIGSVRSPFLFFPLSSKIFCQWIKIQNALGRMVSEHRTWKYLQQIKKHHLSCQHNIIATSRLLFPLKSNEKCIKTSRLGIFPDLKKEMVKRLLTFLYRPQQKVKFRFCYLTV